ncbi:MAG: histidine--tRNA ligase [candidate division WOR-3 bacterium]
MQIKALRGFRDLVGFELYKFERIVNTFKVWLGRFNVIWIETPIVEPLELFVRSVGEFTDIVQKQMFVFKDRGGRDVALRPEGTAGVVRAFLENGLSPPIKLAYFGPMFRGERPQKGRYRQFYQLGVEFLGYSGPYSDAEGILAAYLPLRELNLDVKIYVNTLGGEDTKLRYSEELKKYLKDLDFLCDDCKFRRERNPLRVLDCKTCSPKLNPPDIADFTPDEERDNFEKTFQILKDFGVPVERDPKLVRGLDYYTGLVFEVKAEGLDAAQNTILAGGRYDKLVSWLGGKDTPAFGWAAGIDRISLIYNPQGEREEIYFVVRTSDEYTDVAFNALMRLREMGKKADMVFERGKSLKSQMRRANRVGAKWVVFVGEEEVKTGKFKVKDMETGEEFISAL